MRDDLKLHERTGVTLNGTGNTNVRGTEFTLPFLIVKVLFIIYTALSRERTFRTSERQVTSILIKVTAT